MKQRYKLPICGVSWILAFDSGKMTMQEYKQRYIYIFKMTDKTGNSNRSSSRANTRIAQPNKSDVSITVILPRKKTSLRPHQTQRKCPPINVSLTDDRKQQCGHPNRKYLYLRQYDYTTGTTIDSAEIPTASQVFWTTASPNKVSSNDYDNVRQPEMVLR